MYALEIKTKALKQIASLPRKDQHRLFATFEVLKNGPFVGKKLQGRYKGFHSIRVWPYRIIYAIDRSIITVTIVNVAHRKDAYRS